MNKNKSDSTICKFLDHVTDQISYEPLRPSIRKELESHIYDRMEEYKSAGLSANNAAEQALNRMGDAVTIGTTLNEVHKIQKSPILAGITALLLLTGFVFTSLMRYTPERVFISLSYYLPGVLLLILTAIKGYPFLVCHRLKLAASLILLYLAQMILTLILNAQEIMFPPVTNAYYATLLFIPVITVMLYCTRKHRRKFLIAALGCAGIWMFSIYASFLHISRTAVAIFLLSLFGTICFMIHRHILPGRKKYLYPGTLVLLAIFAAPALITNSGITTLKAFVSPQSAVHTTWDDTYNGILIQELLSETPLTHGIELTPEELMNYGSGAWYFASRDPRQIGVDEESEPLGKGKNYATGRILSKSKGTCLALFRIIKIMSSSETFFLSIITTII